MTSAVRKLRSAKPAAAAPSDLSRPLPTAKEKLRVAYHNGPPAIRFLGIDWSRAVPQTVTDVVWWAMQARGDFPEFDFRIEPAEPPASEKE